MSRKIAAVVAVCLVFLTVIRLVRPPQAAGDREHQAMFGRPETTVWEVPVTWPDSMTTSQEHALPLCSMPVIRGSSSADSMLVIRPDPTRTFTMKVVPANCVSAVPVR